MRRKRKGLVICFLGPDGSGKSTIIKNVRKAGLPFENDVYFHLKPIIPDKNHKHEVVSDPHAAKPYSKIKSYIKLVYFIYQYNLGWIKNIIPLLKKPVLIIFDRYFDDLLVDTKRYRYGGSIKTAKLIRNFIPKPDLYFILTASPDVILNRKEEVARDELIKQLEAYSVMADDKRYFLIDVEPSPEIITEKVISIIKNKIGGN